MCGKVRNVSSGCVIHGQTVESKDSHSLTPLSFPSPFFTTSPHLSKPFSSKLRPIYTYTYVYVYLYMYIVLTKGHQNAAACSYAARWGAIQPIPMERRSVCRASDAIRSGSRYAKWAGGSRSQTHRRAAKGGFTQDDRNVRGLAPTHTILSF